MVDLNLQAGSVADYLDLTPNLHIEEIAASPDRLDAHLLEVMFRVTAQALPCSRPHLPLPASNTPTPI